ncbi:MAG: hypothetical protein QOJ71_704, partial [Actinomycetota bacterium]|nr:hypothetical protein [Actinomycetota bacterium]
MTAPGVGSPRSPSSLRKERAGRRAPVSWGLLGVAGLAGGTALLARANLFPLMSGDSDEPVYVYQG